jgi:thiamine-monophosphate kinase
LAEFFGRRRDHPVGIGDDAAVVANVASTSVITCDPVVAGVHFDPAAAPESVGRKAVLRNLSDLAAMGALPDYLVVSVLLPVGYGRSRERLFAGLRDAAADHECDVVGGDVATTPGPLTVTVPAIGHLAGAPLTRAAARAGDLLFVSGPLGGASLGRHLAPHPRLELGAWLATATPVRAAIDISDGLALDLWTMLQAAGCAGAELYAATLPVHADAIALARASGRRAIEHALHDGEDYELLFTLDPAASLPDGGPLPSGQRNSIGRVLDTPGLWLVVEGQPRERLAPEGYQHGF